MSDRSRRLSVIDHEHMVRPCVWQLGAIPWLSFGKPVEGWSTLTHDALTAASISVRAGEEDASTAGSWWTASLQASHPLDPAIVRYLFKNRHRLRNGQVRAARLAGATWLQWPPWAGRTGTASGCTRNATAALVHPLTLSHPLPNRTLQAIDETLALDEATLAASLAAVAASFDGDLTRALLGRLRAVRAAHTSLALLGLGLP